MVQDIPSAGVPSVSPNVLILHLEKLVSGAREAAGARGGFVGVHQMAQFTWSAELRTQGKGLIGRASGGQAGSPRPSGWDFLPQGSLLGWAGNGLCLCLCFAGSLSDREQEPQGFSSWVSPHIPPLPGRAAGRGPSLRRRHHRGRRFHPEGAHVPETQQGRRNRAVDDPVAFRESGRQTSGASWGPFPMRAWGCPTWRVLHFWELNQAWRHRLRSPKQN